jgi:predicted metal-dependent hydrolase
VGQERITMSQTDLQSSKPALVECPVLAPREGLDFGLEGDIPRHWFAGDAFKTRFFDAMSTLFPEGERFFIACVRDYKDQIEDPFARQLTLDFARQEAQHGKVHAAFNKRLAAQGVKVDRILSNQRRHLFDFARQRFSKLDGYTRSQWLGIWLKGLTWLYGRGGMMRPLIKPYLSWFRPGFHPWHTDTLPGVEVWEQAMRCTGDPIRACDALYAAA